MSRHPGPHGRDTADDAVTTPVPENEPPLVIGHAEMDAALERGAAIPASYGIAWLMRYRAAWWVIYESGWLRVPEGPVAASIDHLYPRLAAAEAAAREEGRP